MFFQTQSHEVLEVCAKILYQLELNRLNVDTMWGFSIEAELVENKDKQDELCCYVSRVEERSVASSNGKQTVDCYQECKKMKQISSIYIYKINSMFKKISRFNER